MITHADDVLRPTDNLTPAIANAITRLVTQAHQTDGVGPLNESALLSLLDDSHPVAHWLVHEYGVMIGYAQLDQRDLSAQLVVAPNHRRRGIGRRLADALDAAGAQTWWAFGGLPGALALGDRLGLRTVRELLIMRRPLGEDLDPVDYPPGIRVDRFRRGDLDQLIRVNAEAFANHPEQGLMTMGDATTRMSQPWFRPEDLLVARDEHGTVVGFHWTKITRDAGKTQGEVYVLAVNPAYERRGIGSALLRSGLLHMRKRGADHAWLYVEADKARVVELYTSDDFETIHKDLALSRRSPMSDQEPADILEALLEDFGPLPDDRYSDRELSWLAFNNRVLDLARDTQRVPLLERTNFTAIFSSNLDEFFMVRVAGLKRRIDAGVAAPSVAGMLPRELHDVILTKAHELADAQAQLFHGEIAPALAAEGIRLLRWEELTEDETKRMHKLFSERVFPVLTPLAVDPSHPFPYISGLSLNLAVLLRHPASGRRQFARVKVPTILSRFVKLGEGRYLPLEEVITHNLDELFTGMQVLQHTTFRVTRNEDLEVEEDDAENLLFALEKELLRRKVGRAPVRLEVEDTIDDEMLDLLISELDVVEKEVFRLPAPLDLTGLYALHDMDRENLKYPNFLPKTHPHLAEVETARPADMFAAIKRRDVLLHHPYDSFATSVQRFIEQAAADPLVLAIKQTLYRTSGDSPIIDALIEAAMAGKQVLALVEIKARFDEQANIAWARKLEKYGVHVVYGMVGLKTHCKLCLVVRDEPDGLHRYAHIGTGNYNPKTARQYEDLGLLTSHPLVTEDVARLFNHLSGMSDETNYRRLLVAPAGVRSGLLANIENEITNKQAGKPAGIRIKVNSIVDEAIIDALYRASQAGIQIQLWVRGICGLKPGIPGLSENIQVHSILGRFLEHSRLFWFANDGNPSVGIGSADLMHRNLDRRVEAIVRLTRPDHIAQIEHLFDVAFDDGTVSWRLIDEEWAPRTTDEDGNALVDMQSYLIEQVQQRRH